MMHRLIGQEPLLAVGNVSPNKTLELVDWLRSRLAWQSSALQLKVSWPPLALFRVMLPATWGSRNVSLPESVS